MTVEPIETVKMLKVIRPVFTVERPTNWMEMGNRQIWARHEEHPQLDEVLVTVHYSYAYQSNGNIDEVAERLARALAGGA
jgi:hypothetical protein